MFHLDPPFAGPLSTYAVTLGYGPCDLAFEPPYNGFAHFHAGTDFGLPMVTPVGACAGGTVAFSGWDQFGYGNRISVDHGGGVQTLYGHLSTLKVAAGQLVSTGDVIAYSGASGNATGPHLHLGVEQDGNWVDAMPWLTYVPPPPPPPPPPLPTEGPRYRVITAMHFRALPSLGAVQGALLPVGTVVIKTYHPPDGQPTETPHWVWCRTGGDVRGYLYKPNLEEVPA